MVFFFADRGFEDLLDLRAPNRIRQRIKDRENQAFAERHFKRHVLAPACAHHSGRKKSDGGMSLGWSLAKNGENTQDLSDMRKLLARLLGEKRRRAQVRRAIKPMPTLDAAHLAIEELVEHPSQEASISPAP